MVVSAGSDWFVKTGDFGISKRRREDTSLQNHFQRGTIGYTAPEALRLGADDAVTSSRSTVDIWSLGAVAYRMLTGSLVFPNIGDLYLYSSGHHPFPLELLVERRVSNNVQDFIAKPMLPVASNRPSAKSAMVEPWMSRQLDPTFGLNNPM